MQIFIRFSSEFLAGHLGREISAATAQNMLRSDTHTHTHTHTQRERESEREREREREREKREERRIDEKKWQCTLTSS